MFIISSPSGGGKGTLIREVLRTVPNIGYSVSFTTRLRRDGETHGKDYFFVTAEEFENLIGSGEFLEFANVHQNFYGTSRRQVAEEIEAGRDVILEIDVQGAASIRRIFPDAVSVFIVPPSFEVLRARLLSRQTETDAELAIRLRNAGAEVEKYVDFQYIVINDEVAVATRDLQAVIYAERLKTERQKYSVEQILKTFI